MGWHIMRRRHTCTLKEVKMQRMPGSGTRGVASNVQRRAPENSQGWIYSSVIRALDQHVWGPRFNSTKEKHQVGGGGNSHAPSLTSGSLPSSPPTRRPNARSGDPGQFLWPPQHCGARLQNSGVHIFFLPQAHQAPCPESPSVLLPVYGWVQGSPQPRPFLTRLRAFRVL